MSWRASPSRPAPPITSTSVDSLFTSSSPSPSSSASSIRSYRSPSSSSSAASHLARHISMEDDSRSIRSNRSTITLNGGGRARKGSGASCGTFRTVRRASGTDGGERGVGDGAEEMELESPSESGKGKGKERESESASASSLPTPASNPTSPPSDPTPAQESPKKRQKTELSTSTGWLGSRGKGWRAASTSAAAPVVAVSEDTTPKLVVGTASGEGEQAGSQTEKGKEKEKALKREPSLVAFVPSHPTTSTSATTTSTSAEPSNRRTSWFNSAPSLPLSRGSSSASLSKLTISPNIAPQDPPSIVEPIAEAIPEMSLNPVKEEPKVVPGGGGWLSRLSPMIRSVSQSSGLYHGGEDKKVEENGDADGDVSMKDGTTETEADATEESTGANGTIKASTSPSLDDNTLRPARREIPSVANQRNSWWGWGGAAPAFETAPESIHETQPEPEMEVEETPQKAESVVSTESVSALPPQQPKTWMQTIWGGGPAPVPAVDKTTEPAAEVEAEPRTSTSSIHSDEVSVLPPPQAPLPVVQSLRHKSSWFFSSSEASTSGASTPSYPISSSQSQSQGRTVSQMSKSPRTGLGIGSITSSRPSSSHTNDSAPNSPRLGPQSHDGPVKPLTGSIRSSPRPGPYEPDPPFENLVLPTYEDTFSRPPRSFPPKKRKLTKAVSVVSAYLFSQPPSPNLGEREWEKKFVDPAERLPKDLEVMGEMRGERLKGVRRVVTIGVHGWFPNPMLKSVMGEPTGTSIKFATQMHDAVQSYLESHDISSFNIQAIALEGQGKIDDRVNRLYDQLVGREEWLQALKKADAVFLATHSQGSIVSTHLLARMLEKGLVQGGKTHMLAMCGIVQGPFVYLSQSYTLSPYFNYLESAAARELFEFQDPNSAVAVKFLESLRSLLDHGLKITTIGSMNDQVVPLYSSLFAGISHPSLIRAVYIDSAAFRTSDFLANLVVFACRLKNANLSDHDLLYHVSEALAGALTGIGHSIVYESLETFSLAVRYQFESTPLAEAPTHLMPPLLTTDPLTMSFNPRAARNPYLLTWALRGIIEDPLVRDLFGNELMALREAFETWRPATKVLKDVKLKLEGIRMLPRVKKEGKL